MEIRGKDNLKALKQADRNWVSNCGNDYEIESFRVKSRTFITITNEEYCASSSSHWFPGSFEHLAYNMVRYPAQLFVECFIFSTCTFTNFIFAGK